MKLINKVDGHLAKPFRFRRWVLASATLVALLLVVYCTVTGTPLQGENVLLALVGGGSVAYTASRTIERIRGLDSSDEQDI